MKPGKEIRCPDCSELTPSHLLKDHILICRHYRKKILNNTIRLAETLNCDDLKFLMAELDMVRETILDKMSQPSHDPVKFGTY